MSINGQRIDLRCLRKNIYSIAVPGRYFYEVENLSLF